VSLTVVVTGGVGFFSTRSNAEGPDWLDKETGEIHPDLMPERIMIGTDLFDAGYGWLESQNFREPERSGPYMIYESEDSARPAYWYYKGMDIVPIGTKFDSALTFEVPISEPEGK
jgi:hypothetical protein